MKKLFTLLSLVMLFAFTANAQQRKTWDFSKGVSEESRANLDADGTNWSSTKNTETLVSVSWASNTNINGEAVANGTVVKELAGLHFADFSATNALLYRITSIRLQKKCSMTIKDLKAGQQIVFVAQSANNTATNRGFLLDNAADAEGNSSFTLLGKNAEGAPEEGVYTITVNVIADGDVKLSTGLTGAPAEGIEILSIVIDEGDKNIKTWNFSSWSEATKTQICAAEDWGTAETASKDYITDESIRWNNVAAVYDANGDITAGGEAIAEMKGLKIANVAAYGLGAAFNYQTTQDGNNWGPYNSGSYLWVMGTATTITVPKVKAGSVLKVASESHKLIPAGTSDARGFNVTVNGAAIASTTGVSTSTDYTVFEYTMPESEDGYFDVTLKATKGCHLYSIEAEVKDETVEDKNPRLGSIVYAPKTNTKITTDAEFTINFPNAYNIDGETPVTVCGKMTNPVADTVEEFDGIEGTVTNGIAVAFSDLADLAENTQYILTITKIEVGNDETAFHKIIEPTDAVFTYTTKGPGIKEARAWSFTLTQETAEAIAQAIDAGTSNFAASSKGRYSVKNQMNNSPIYITDGVELPNTVGLYFTMSNSNDILFGTPAHTGVGGAANGGGNNGNMQLGGGVPHVIIPSCSAGDEITIKALWSTKNAGQITIVNGTCDGSNTITLTGSAVEYKIVVTSDDDVVLQSKNTVYNSISIYPYNPNKKEINYTVVAKNAAGEVLKTYAEGTGLENDKIEGTYSYWLTDASGSLYTKGAKGTPFTWSASLVDEDPIVLEYADKSFDGMLKAVYCSEAESLENTVVTTAANSKVRSSNCAAANADVDITLTTLEPGFYKIRAIIFDGNKGGGVATQTFTVGETDYTLTSDSENFSEVETEMFEVTAAAQVVWKAGDTASVANALDAVLIYQVDPTIDSIDDINVNTVNASAKKIINNGRLVIKTAKGTFNVAGAQMK